MNITIYLPDDPNFQALLTKIEQLEQQVQELQQAVPAWVPVEMACDITGLSATSLWRERKKPDTVLKSKQDHGLRYERASLLAYNKTRTEVKPRGRRQS